MFKFTSIPRVNLYDTKAHEHWTVTSSSHRTNKLVFGLGSSAEPNVIENEITLLSQNDRGPFGRLVDLTFKSAMMQLATNEDVTCSYFGDIITSTTAVHCKCLYINFGGQFHQQILAWVWPYPPFFDNLVNNQQFFLPLQNLLIWLRQLVRILRTMKFVWSKFWS